MNSLSAARSWNGSMISEENVGVFKVRGSVRKGKFQENEERHGRVKIYHRLALQVGSATGLRSYTVDIEAINPTCTCRAWVQSELPCKHIFAVLENSSYNWEDLSAQFR